MKSAFVLFLFLSAFTAYAQQSDGTKYIIEAEPHALNLLNKKFYEEGKLPVRSIVVRDYRFDTSKIGYTDPGALVSHYLRISPGADWSRILNNYFSNNLDPASPNTLFIIIRSYWMQEGLLDELTNKKVVKQEWMGRTDIKGGSCEAALDIFLSADSVFLPLFKLEATFLNFRKFKAGNLDEWFFLPCDSMARRLFKKPIPPDWKQGKTITAAAISNAYGQRFNKPVLNNSNFSRGVFMSFADFCNNKISYPGFSFHPGRITDELYTGSSKEDKLLTDYWGFYDGKQLFIRSDFNAFPAVRCGNTWEVYGAKHISNVHSNAQPGDVMRVNSMELFRKILQVDMEKGEFY